MANVNKPEVQEALRVSQLDATELDSELFQLLQGQLENAFKYFKPDILARFSSELSAVLRFVLWKFSVQALESTIGQQLLDLRYKSEIHSQGGSTVWMTGRQKWLYAVLIIGGPWLEERRDYLASITREYKYGDKLWKIIDVVVGGWKVAALINFLVFLSRGHYQYLVERILGVRAVFPRPQGIRQIGFEYMDRELLWHGFAEFLFFILPLINFNKVKNFLKRQFIPVSNIKKPVVRSIEDYHECAVCGQWPYNPREIGCPHVFCYYCIQSNYQADSSYACPVCGLKIESCDQIQILTQTLQKES